MKKRTWILALACVAAFLTLSCEEIVVDLTKPNVTYQVLSNGAQLRLTWAAVTDAEGYKVQVDDSTYTTANTTVDVDGPAKSISVWAYKGTTESPKWTEDFAAEVTATLEVWGTSDPSPDHPSGLGFLTDGSCVAYSLETANHPKLDYVMDDQAQAPDMYFYSPNNYSPPYNDKDNGVKEETGTDFDAVQSASSPGSGYYTAYQCVAGTVYSLWIDPNANGWDDQDHFAKVKVESIDGVKVTMKLAYQKVAGLLWLRTD